MGRILRARVALGEREVVERSGNPRLTDVRRRVTFRLAPSWLSVPPLHMRLSFALGLFWSSVACCAIAQLYILRSVGGGRHLAEPAAGVPREQRRMEVIWALLPAIALAVLLFFTWKALQAPRDDREPLAPPRGASR